MSDPIADAVAVLAELGGLPPSAERALAEAVRPRTLRAGECLFEAGAPADGMIVVDRGRLGVLGADDEILATLGRGELVGEMGALTGEPRTRTVIALRDTTVAEIDQVAFDRLFESNPVVGRALSRLVVGRLVNSPDIDHRRAVPGVVAVVTAGGVSESDELVKALASRVGSARIVGEELTQGRTEAEVLAALDAIEADQDLVILLAGEATAPDRSTQADDWFDRCLRHADAILVVIANPPPPAAGPIRLLGPRLAELRSTVELVVVNPSGAAVGSNASTWVARIGPDRLHHVRTGDPVTIDRCARLVLGQGTGLVFSGGAAKGLAHLGAWRALCELDIEIDAVAGVSFGALLGAGVALDYTPEELQSEVQERLVSERGLVDLTFPWMALLRGEGVTRRLEDVGQGRAFEQTWRSFVCTSCDLTTGEVVEHRAGPLWEAIRASVSIPGVLPPVRVGERLLVDGAIRSNLPIAPLRDGHPTPMKVIAIDVGKDGVLPVGETPERGTVSGWKLVARQIHPRRPAPGVPSMPKVLMRVMELAGEEGDAVADQVVRPDLSKLGVGDFNEIENFVRAGYEATLSTLG